MNLKAYLSGITGILEDEAQRSWLNKLEAGRDKGLRLYVKSDSGARQKACQRLANRIRTEEIKAWYSAPEEAVLFQGTSVSSLIIPYERSSPLDLGSVTDLEESIADAYIEMHDKYAGKVKDAIIENIDKWLDEGLYYGVALGSKVISQAFGLSARYDEVVFSVDQYLVDPHEITSFPERTRASYFKKCLERLSVFNGLDLERRELESSLVLADISKPKIERFRDRILLAPVRCNEIAALLSARITLLISRKSNGRINPAGLAVVIYDTDTPYTYHEIMGYCKDEPARVLPGLVVLGSSGTIDAFRWLYSYRISLIAQKLMKSSLYSEVYRKFIPFVFFGVLVPRDAEILLGMKDLHRLRYRGNLDPDAEFGYLAENLLNNN